MPQHYDLLPAVTFYLAELRDFARIASFQYIAFVPFAPEMFIALCVSDGAELTRKVVMKPDKPLSTLAVGRALKELAYETRNLPRI